MLFIFISGACSAGGWFHGSGPSFLMVTDGFLQVTVNGVNSNREFSQKFFVDFVYG